ncbi:receptor-like protein EIX2 [Lactuca sativa]|uniref:receptor-like protein EIX2 n=1 Tax=Lactuca sativa TaxID=4236 RepID=UPI001C68D18F|nr:receptor-like protein EIX2 [Lactuca sativa]
MKISVSLKTLQHQLTCTDALLKTMNLELQAVAAVREMNDQKDISVNGDNTSTKQQTANRCMHPIRSQYEKNYLIIVSNLTVKSLSNTSWERRKRDLPSLIKAPLQDPDGRLSSWTVEDDECCKWSGVTCNNQTGCVIGLDFRYGQLGGELSHSLLNLTYSNHLDLHYNFLNGTIPRSISSLRELRYLDLSSNSLYGTIPPDFGNLTNLQVLSVRYVGGCRVENIEWLSRLSHLEKLQMDGISLAKANEWVDVILSLPKLSWLSLGRCELSQVMYPYSSSFLNSSSSSSIEDLDLSGNNLTSSMYHWLFPLTSNKLQCLYLSDNILDGMPKYLGNLCSLEQLEFNNNSSVVKFPDFLHNLSGRATLILQGLFARDNKFTGSLSDEIQKFSSLQYLYLSRSQLNGSISEKLWKLPRLEYLDLSYNNLTVPSKYHLSRLSYLQSIYLRSCKLLGPRFPKWIQTFKNLTVLDISTTGISDTAPLEFWDMWPSQLQYLNLSSNNISETVLDLSSNFANDSEIDLSSNRFSGPIPNVSSTLSTLNLSRNNCFTGGISFICQIVGGFLSFLDLSHNSLIGQLPDCLWRFKGLQVLNIGHNNLFGRIPPSIGSLIQLKVLYLYENDFSGGLPLSLKTCTSLKSLNLGANKFSRNVPVWIGENLSGLYVLILRSNNFFGTIPLELCQLENVQILDLSMNNLHGSIPSCFSNLTSMVQQGFSQGLDHYKIESRYSYEPEIYVDHAMIEWQGDEREFFSTVKLVKSIDLSSNKLTGQLPYEITNIYDLIVMNLSKNALFGEIPEKIGEIKKRLTLDLSRNSFSGHIPPSMSQMTLLNYLDVSFNNLSGRIPTSTQLQSFQPSRYDGNTRLCGPPLTKKMSRR